MSKKQKNSAQGKPQVQTGASSQWSIEYLEKIEGFNKSWLKGLIVRLSNDIPENEVEDPKTVRILPFSESEFEMVKKNTAQNVEIIYAPNKA